MGIWMADPVWGFFWWVWFRWTEWECEQVERVCQRYFLSASVRFVFGDSSLFLRSFKHFEIALSSIYTLGLSVVSTGKSPTLRVWEHYHGGTTILLWSLECRSSSEERSLPVHWPCCRSTDAPQSDDLSTARHVHHNREFYQPSP